MRAIEWKMKDEWYTIGKSGNDARLVEEKRTNLKYENRNMVYNIHEGIIGEN